MFCSLYLICEICKPLWGLAKRDGFSWPISGRKITRRLDALLVPFSQKNYFFLISIKYQKQLLIRGIQPRLAPLVYPSALLSNKGALFQEHF